MMTQSFYSLFFYFLETLLTDTLHKESFALALQRQRELTMTTTQSNAAAEEVERFLNELVLDASKAALKSPQLDEMHENDAEIYLFLYIYFQKASIRQRREDSIAISKEGANSLLQSVLTKALALPPSVSTKPKIVASSDGKQYSKLDDGVPLVQQRLLREQLSSLKPASCVNLAAFADVVEMCRWIDQQLGLPNVFGAVNIVTFVAVYLTLTPTRRLFDLIELVWKSVSIPESVRIKIFFTWSVVDAVNREALVELCDALESRPGLNIPMILEFFPHVEHINTARYRSIRNHATGLSVTASAPKTAVHDADEEVVVLSPPQNAPIVVHHNEADGDDDDEDDGRTDEDRAFWAALVS